MSRTIDYKEQLNTLLEQMKEQGNTINIVPIRSLPSIPDPFGVLVQQDSGVTETKVFISDFSVNDVDEFLFFLTNTPPLLHRYDLEELLKRNLENWCYHNQGRCPYEIFLWALKITDNYIGSLQNNAMPQPWIVESVGKALASVWDNKNQKYMCVLRNVLDSWDWYQPIHVMLYLYQCLSVVHDEDVDKCIREKWLYRALYSVTALKCLCQKKKTRENIQALMRFVSQDIQRDSNMAEIQITQKMRQEVINYIQSSSEEEFACAKTYYTDFLYNCSKKARESFDVVFFGGGKNDEIQRFIADWKVKHTEKEIRVLRKRLNNLFQKDADCVISEIAASKSSELIQEILRIIEQQEITFETQFWIRAIVKSANFCRHYYDFIIEKFQKYGLEVMDDKSFVYGCAFCYLGHPEILSNLFQAHFWESVGLANGRFIFADLRVRYPKQFNEQIDSLTKSSLLNEEHALALIISCSKIYNTKNAVFYPTTFKKVCLFLLEKVLEENHNSARYASALMDLLERIVNVQNRGEYILTLQKITFETSSYALENVRSRAKKLIKSIYGAL